MANVLTFPSNNKAMESALTSKAHEVDKLFEELKRKGVRSDYIDGLKIYLSVVEEKEALNECLEIFLTSVASVNLEAAAKRGKIDKEVVTGFVAALGG
jgi:hypothetical protein